MTLILSITLVVAASWEYSTYAAACGIVVDEE
jgi:hypothetical protein